MLDENEKLSVQIVPSAIRKTKLKDLLEQEIEFKHQSLKQTLLIFRTLKYGIRYVPSHIWCLQRIIKIYREESNPQ